MTCHATLEITPRGHWLLWLAAATVLGAWLSGDDHVRLAAALLLAPLLLDLLAKLRACRFVTVEVAPRRTAAGALFREQLALHNGSRATVRDLLVAEPATHAPPVLVTALGPGDRALLQLHCHSTVRGRRESREFELRTGWPLGLFVLRRVAAAAAELVTEPARVALDERWSATAADRQAGQSPRRDLAGDEFHALREHQTGDDARGVHALRSAARGQLVRTVTHGRLPAELGLVLDLRSAAGKRRHGSRRHFEWSLGAVATLLDRLGHEQRTLRLWLLGTGAERLSAGNQEQRQRVLARLATAAPAEHWPLPPELLRELEALDECLWVAASNHRPDRELGPLRRRVRLLRGRDR